MAPRGLASGRLASGVTASASSVSLAVERSRLREKWQFLDLTPGLYLLFASSNLERVGFAECKAPRPVNAVAGQANDAAATVMVARAKR